MSSPQDDAPIIVFGAARSGTTYLVHMLNSHPQIYISDETRIFVWAHQCLDVLPQSEVFLYRGRDDIVNYLYGQYGALVRGYYKLKAPERPMWGDKNPHYLADDNKGCLNTILRLFPKTRFIHLIRDGRDVVTSGLRGVWRDFEAVHHMWKSHVHNGRQFGATLPTGQYYELRYEDLVQNDLEAARGLCGFLRVDFDSKLAAFCETQAKTRTPYCAPSRDLSSGVTSSEWAEVLSPRQRLASLEILGEELIACGYETPKSLAAAFASLKDALNLVQVEGMRAVLRAVLPVGGAVAVVSRGDDELLQIPGHTAMHFPQTKSGGYTGFHPANGAEAIAHLESVRAKGARYLVVPQHCSWWLEHYACFREYLQHNFSELATTEFCQVFDLRQCRTL